MKIGIDIGSTTIKCIVLDDSNNLIFKSYKRHFSKIREMSISMLENIKSEIDNLDTAEIYISGSAGMGVANNCGLPFVQEVYATKIAVNNLVGDVDAVIELGGEDAKILFLSNGLEVRMNGSCAGGTGAFIDQMATLLNISPSELNEIAKQYNKIYSIASRCGVFAKSDIQPLLNQGAQHNDIAASIFHAVVNQTIAGLAQGRKIEGKVLYLGGPLTFLSELRNSFDEILNVEGICPENSLYFVAIGAALSNVNGESKFVINDVIEKISDYNVVDEYLHCPPLFENKEEYGTFCDRHAKANINVLNSDNYCGSGYLGIDAGSTTVKVCLADEQENIIFSAYKPNNGSPVVLIKEILLEIFEKHPNVNIVSSAVTGYGEDIIKNAFCIDYGVVETVAHFTAAKKFLPNVDFIIDIGGQDIKCFKIKNNAIDNIFLNEACSSGCGSFLQTFAGALKYSIEDFAKLGLFATAPVDLGSRCTVFMNSSVKQAQKDGATIENISAGLSTSVVKNAIYKVIRVNSTADLGVNIVVQGGTFLNDAVLRAFEKEIGHNVVRPTISGLMGAYGAALYAKKNSIGKSKILDKASLKSFKHDVKAVVCKKCTNHCSLTISTFDGSRRFIGGNRCEKPVTNVIAENELNIYEYKYKLLNSYLSVPGARGKIGIPMGLNMYEMLPFWHAFFTKLGFEVVVSPSSNRALYLKGQQTIPSDTICFPAKLMHGHIEHLIEAGIENIFYPCMTYNFDEKKGDKNFNCPVVAYYPEVISSNVSHVKNINFINEYIGIHKQRQMPKKFYEILSGYFPDITYVETKKALKHAKIAQKHFAKNIREKGEEIIGRAENAGMPVIVLAGRPYHVDPEVNHSIDKLICSCGAALISEDVLSHKVPKFKVNVLNQWTYHARMYSAAKYVSTNSNMNLVQLVSFGCGLDAVTTDEIRDILEKNKKIYTQIKIDEITNLGAVKIRLRSLFAALAMEGDS